MGKLKFRQTGRSLAYKFGYLAYIWGEVRGLRNRITFTLRLAAAQIAPNLFRRSDRIATARVPLRDFDVVFKLLRGELTRGLAEVQERVAAVEKQVTELQQHVDSLSVSLARARVLAGAVGEVRSAVASVRSFIPSK